MTADGILNVFKKSGALQFERQIEQAKQILDTFCLENVILKVKSNETGEFVSISIGSKCYKPKLKQKKTGALALIPCGACTHINQCHPNGILSSAT